MKPYSESCEQNRQPILEVIQPLFSDCQSVLEIGSGTGQHAVYFAAKLPHLVWHTSDRQAHHSGICSWLNEAGLSNTRMPLVLDVAQQDWPQVEVDAVFSANTAHIMHWPEVVRLFAGVGPLLTVGGLFVLYGPFNYNGAFTSESNKAFDGWLKNQHPAMGVRDFEAVNQLAQKAGLSLHEDYAMPANNRILCWQRRE